MGKIKEDECNIVLDRGVSCPDVALMAELWETIKNEKHAPEGRETKTESHRPVALSEHGTVRQGAMGAVGNHQEREARARRTRNKNRITPACGVVRAWHCPARSDGSMGDPAGEYPRNR